MADSTKKQFKRGLLWHGTEKILGQGASFVVGIILARLLSPSDYGLIGMLAIFISLSSQFVDGGFSNALIQKNTRCTKEDYSTAFVVNVFMSLVFYILLFVSAPWIADFYDEPVLCPLARVLGLNFIFGAFNIVQIAKLTGSVNFKALAKIRVTASIVSGIVGVTLAYNGWGVWALAGQTLSNTVCCFLMYPFFSAWRFSVRFSKEAFKGLFNFGGKLLLSEMIGVVIGGVNSMLIGKFYSSASLGFFTKANEIPSKLGAALSSIIGTVSFPVLSGINEKQSELVSAYRKLLFNTMLTLFPVFILLTALTQPLVKILFTEKWLPCVPLMQIMLLSRIVSITSSIHMTTLKAAGHADYYLKADVFKIPITVAIMAITIPISVKAVVIGGLCSNIIGFLINAYYPGKIWGYGVLKQLKDWRYIFLCVLVMYIFVWGVTHFVKNDWVQLFGGMCVGGAVFAITGYLTGVINTQTILFVINRS